MKRAAILVEAFVSVSPTIVLAQTAGTKPTPNNDFLKALPTIVPSNDGFILRQDLVDSNNPNNLRSHWPRTSGMPGPS